MEHECCSFTSENSHLRNKILHVYVCVCVYIYIYTHTYIYVHINQLNTITEAQT